MTELSTAAAVAKFLPRLFEVSKGVEGDKVTLIIRSIDAILRQLARFGPSVISTLIENGSGGSPVFSSLALEYLLYQQTLNSSDLDAQATETLDALFGSSTIPVASLSLHQLFSLLGTNAPYSMLHALYELITRSASIIHKTVEACAQPCNFQRIRSRMSKSMRQSLSSVSVLSHSTDDEDKGSDLTFTDDFLNHVVLYEQNRNKDLSQLLRSLRRTEAANQSVAIKHAKPISQSYVPSDSGLKPLSSISEELNDDVINGFLEVAESVSTLRRVIKKCGKLDYGDLSYSILKEACLLLVEYCKSSHLCLLLWDASGHSIVSSRLEVINQIFLLLGSTSTAGFSDCPSFFAIGCVLLAFFREYQGEIVAFFTRCEV